MATASRAAALSATALDVLLENRGGREEQVAKLADGPDREEHEPGIYCVAAAFGGEEFGFIGGISVTAPAYRIDKKKLKKWEFEVSAAALAIENDLRARLGPRSLN